jgi:hypothetical protein
MKNTVYNYPAGYSFMQTAFKSNKFIENPINFMQQSIGKFGNTYSASLGIKKENTYYTKRRFCQLCA